MLAWIFATVLALIALAFIANRRYFIGWALHAIAGLVLINHYMDVNWSLVSTLIFIGLLVVIGVWAFSLRLPQFGLLAFMPVLYLTLQMQGADLHPVVQIFFWVFWVVGLISASIHSFPRGNATAWCVFVAAVLMICLNGLIASSNGEQFNPSVATNNIGGEQAWVAASQGTGTTPTTCPDTIFQEWDPNTGFRLVSTGLRSNDGEVTVEDAQPRQWEKIGTDARYLASTAWSLGLRDDPNKVAPLMTADKSCLSKEGITLRELVSQKWATATSTEIAEAPANGTNTGSNNGTFVVAADSGIEGDRTALVRKYSGATTVDLIRCGNHVLPGKPNNVPPGRTDNPPPKSPPTTQSPPATTPPATPPASTPPPTTAPPTTMPPTSQPPTTAPPTTQPPTETKGPVIVPSGDSTQGPPPGPVETAPIVEPTPAGPEDVPGEEVTNGPAPEVTQEPARDPIPDPDPAVPTTPQAGDVDPTSPGPVIPGLALGALGIGMFLRRKEFLDA
jgi:hypothetical protein